MAVDDPNTFLTLTEAAPAFTVAGDGRVRVTDAPGDQVINAGANGSVQLQALSGQNRVTIDADSDAFDISRAGLQVTLSGPGGREIVLSAGDTAQTLVFRDGAAELRLASTNGSQAVQLGDQVVDTTSAPVDPDSVGLDTNVDFESLQQDNEPNDAPVTRVVDVSADRTGPLDATTGGQKTFNVLPGAYTAQIDGFASGDSLNVFADATVNIPTDTNLDDGDKLVRFTDPDTNDVTEIRFTGLSTGENGADGRLVQESDFDNVFGTGTFAKTGNAPDNANTFVVLTDAASRLDVAADARTDIVDAAGAQTINVSGGGKAAISAGTGNNTIQVDGLSDNFTVQRSGLEVTLSGAGGTEIQLGAREESQSIVFRDGAADLRFDDSGSNPAVRLGQVNVDESATALAGNMGLDRNTTSEDTFSRPLGDGDTVQVNATNTGPFDATVGDVTFELTAGTYTAVIQGFDTGDQIVSPSDSSYSFPTDTNINDGVKPININHESGNTTAVRLTGLTAGEDSQDSNAFNTPSFANEFGDDALM